MTRYWQTWTETVFVWSCLSHTAQHVTLKTETGSLALTYKLDMWLLLWLSLSSSSCDSWNYFKCSFYFFNNNKHQISRTYINGSCVNFLYKYFFLQYFFFVYLFTKKCMLYRNNSSSGCSPSNIFLNNSQSKFSLSLKITL